MDKVLRQVNRMNGTKIPFVSKLIHFILRIIYCCDIMPGTKIGEGTRFPHRGLGVVINQNAVIGKNCIVEANVCIGGNGKTREGIVAPQIGDNVLIGSNSVIIGPINIGSNVKIGAGSVVVKDVPDNSVVVGNPGHVVSVSCTNHETGKTG